MPQQMASASSWLATPHERWIQPSPAEPMQLHVLEWPGAGRPFVLLHGLASNATTWSAVARELAARGHRVIAVDQRGHGRSDKPDNGYDFATIVADVAGLLDALEVADPVIAGQSWGGNVVLAFGAMHPRRAHRLVFVDGGFLDLQARPGMNWERIAVDLRPPDLAGMPRALLAERIRSFHPEWQEEGIEATLANFEALPDGTVRPWLTLDRHMRILRALWEQRPADLYPLVERPVAIAVAEDAGNPEWMAVKHVQVAAAETGLRNVRVHWFADTAHDIHVHRPAELAAFLLEEPAAAEGGER